MTSPAARDTAPWMAVLERDGFAVIPSVVGPDQVGLLTQAVTGLPDADGVRRRGSVYGVRNLLDIVPAARDLASSAHIRELAVSALGPGAFPVRSLLFDKTPDANWNVAWHQDMTIAVRERRDVPGFGPWSEKAGVVHVQPPASFLERMLTIRLHLDPCDGDNGPLRVLPGSHRQGRLDADAIRRCRSERPEVFCTVPAGGVMLMRPLLLHASSDARRPGHRRVVHLDYATDALPGGLQWHSQPLG